MQILGVIKTDQQGRVIVSRLFCKDELPKKLVISFDTETKRLIFTDVRDVPMDWWVIDVCSVDPKGRVVIPKWLRSIVGDEFLVPTDARRGRYLLPLKFFKIC